MKEHAAYFENIIDSCIECGLCTRIQEQSGCFARNFASFARDMLATIEEGSFKTVAGPVWTCTMCGACTARCPAAIDAYEFMHQARCVLNPKQPDIIQKFAPMRTDLDSNPFAQLRAIRKPVYPDALDEDGACKALFFPGCALGTYAPELTAAVFEHLYDTGKADGISYTCCSNPLFFMGDSGLLRQATADLADKLHAYGVEEIIVACPSCYAALCRYQNDGVLDESLCMTPLPVLLAEQGMAIDPHVLENAGFDTVCVKDACRDRNDGVFATSVRQLLGNIEVVELHHTRRNSRCCGSGGLVPLYDADAADEKRWAVLQEFDDTETSCLVTMCVNCSLALRQDGDTNIVHYLELLFDQPIDWDAL